VDALRRRFLLGSVAAAGLEVGRQLDIEPVGQVPRLGRHSVYTLVLDGRPLSRAKWVDSPRNPFPAALKEMMPWQYVPTMRPSG